MKLGPEKENSAHSPQAKRLLVLVIPAGDDQHEHWRHSRFQEAEEKSNGIQPLVVVTGGRRHLAGAPEKDDKCCDALDWVPLSDEDGWIGASDEAEIIDGCCKRIAVAGFKAEICPQAE